MLVLAAALSAAEVRAAGVLMACVAAVAAGACHAEERAEPPHWKLTLGEYFYPSAAGTDVNLRWRNDDTDAWVGFYHDPVFGTQSRTGVDTSLALAKNVQLQPSLQLATGGFIGGSVNLQVGDVWYAYVGLGRTNLRPYFNLNFDPNDAVTWGIGHRADGGATATVFVVADNRLGTGQQDWHLNVGVPLQGSHTVFDLLYKRGEGDTRRISAWGGSVTWNWRQWFVRAARDPYQNFSAQDAWRVSTGLRF